MQQQRGQKRRFPVSLVTVCLCLFFFSSNAMAEKKYDKVRLQLRWSPQFQFAGYYAAKYKGFYEKAGLDVSFVERDFSVSTLDSVLQGKADFGIANCEILVQRLSGKPIVALAALFQHSPVVLAVPGKTNFTSLHDLIGKRVVMSTAMTNIELIGMFRAENIELSQLQLIDRLSTVADFDDPSIDAIALFGTNERFYYDSRNIPHTAISPVEYGIDFYGDCLFTTEEQIQKHPERVRAFRKASLQGWEYALQHPNEIIDLIKWKYGSKKSLSHLAYEAEAIRKIMQPEFVEIGHMNAERWQHIAGVFADLGIVQNNASFANFLYDPHKPIKNVRTEYFLFGLGGVALLLAMGATILICFNRRLKARVQERTEALTLKAAELESANARLTELDRMKSALLSSVSHELRTPMTAILGFVKLIGRDFNRTFAPLAENEPVLEEKRERIRKYLGVVSVEGERLTRLISDVLDLSKIESGNATWRDANIDVGDLARMAVAIVQEQFAHNPKTDLLVDIQNTLPKIYADPDRIVQVLINLLGNAAKFTPRGEVRLTIVGQDREIQIEVSDTGIGIAEEDIDNIFNMFHQVRRGDTLRFGAQGAGLGLAITKDIVEHYEGTISIESQLGVGSRFVVTLPALKVFF